jgi:hypothetical protein
VEGLVAGTAAGDQPDASAGIPVSGHEVHGLRVQLHEVGMGPGESAQGGRDRVPVGGMEGKGHQAFSRGRSSLVLSISGVPPLRVSPQVRRLAATDEITAMPIA